MGDRFDVVVIGAGPGGYVAAIKTAKEGLRTAVVEENMVGGTCLNRGCIPAKAMIHASSLYREMKDSERFGVLAPEVGFDYKRILEYKEETTDKLRRGVENLLKANGVETFAGKGILEKGKNVRVVNGRYEQMLEAKNIILASGSKPLLLPIPGLDLPGILTSNELFGLGEMPESLVIIGGGVIGVEFASVYADLGCKVTIVEALPRILPNMDKEISQNLKMILKKRGIDIHTSASIRRIEKDGELFTCVFAEKEKENSVSGQYVLCAVGRRPNTDGLFGEGVNLQTERGRIIVDEHLKSSMDGVYAIGDLIKGTQLAHAAGAQGSYVAELIAGRNPSIELKAVPGCVYTDPEIASVGLTEDEAKGQGLDVKTGKFIMSANAKSLITKEERGFIKVVLERETQKILGAQMMCARATDMIGEFVTAAANHMTAGQLIKAMRPHPTYNEGIAEALEDAAGKAVHVMPKKRDRQGG